MNHSRTFALFITTLALALGGDGLRAQTPAPIVVQAATATNSVAPAAPPAVQASEPDAATVTLLQQMKATNDDILKKQEATLQYLDELQKAADQLKVFSKRG